MSRKLAPRPPRGERQKIQRDHKIKRDHFVFDPDLIRFYHTRSGKYGDATLAVTVVKDLSGDYRLYTAVARRHSNDPYFYGLTGEIACLDKLNKALRQAINGQNLVSPVTQVKPALPPREDPRSVRLWNTAINDDPKVTVFCYTGSPTDTLGPLDKTKLFGVKPRVGASEL